MHFTKKILAAVLTADIVDSTRFSPAQESALQQRLRKFLDKYPREFYRGDSFQVYFEDPKEALRRALAFRALAIEATTKEEGGIRGDIRVSIGIGEVDLPVRTLGEAKGEAFVLSGRGLDELQQSERRLHIACSNSIANIGLRVMSDYLDNIFSGMTGKQADIIVELLQGTTQQQLSVTREKAKSTISELANAGKWPEIEKILIQYEQLIELLP
jgi:hypothetical protein